MHTRTCSLAHGWGINHLKSHPQTLLKEELSVPSQVCKPKRMKVAFFPHPVCHFPHVAAGIMQVYRKAGFFIFNACMRIKVKPPVSAMHELSLPAAATEPTHSHEMP